MLLREDFFTKRVATLLFEQKFSDFFKLNLITIKNTLVK